MSTLAEIQSHQIAESNTVSMFERMARDPSVDVVKLQQLMELQERVIARDAKSAFAAAFAQMQGQIPVITKSGEIKVDNKVRSRFARFEDIDRIIKPILQEHGFSLMHKRVFGDKSLTVTSILMHKAGHSEETSFIAAADTSGSKNAIQALGSTDAYGRRYNTIALLNIATSDDDDGNGTSLITEDHCETLRALMDETKTNETSFLRVLKIAALEELPELSYPVAVGFLEAKRKVQK